MEKLEGIIYNIFEDYVVVRSIANRYSLQTTNQKIILG